MNVVVDMLTPILSTKKGSLCNQQIINNTIQISSHEVSGLNHFNLKKTNICYVLQRVLETLPRRKKKEKIFKGDQDYLLYTFKKNTIVCSIHCVLCIKKYCGNEGGLTYVFNQHIVPLMRLFQWRGDEVRDGYSSAGSGTDEIHQLARVKLTCKQCGLIQGQPRQVDLKPAICTQKALNTKPVFTRMKFIP